MRAGWAFVLAAGLAVRPAVSQVSLYADFSASRFTNLNGSTTAFGPTFGLDGVFASKGPVRLGGDIRGFYYSGGNLANGSSNLSLTGLSLGPRVAFKVRRFEPYGEFLVGFARYNDGDNTSVSHTTDAQLEANFGVDRAVTSRFDWRILDFGYKQFYGLGGQFNPKTFSTGIVFHFAKR